MCIYIASVSPIFFNFPSFLYIPCKKHCYSLRTPFKMYTYIFSVNTFSNQVELLPLKKKFSSYSFHVDIFMSLESWRQYINKRDMTMKGNSSAKN